MGKSFGNLKRTITSTPILVDVDQENPVFIEVDASDFALGSILSKVEMMGSYIHLLFIYAILKLLSIGQKSKLGNKRPPVGRKVSKIVGKLNAS